MVRVRHGQPMIIGGRNEIYARDNGVLSADKVQPYPLEPSPERLAEIVQWIGAHKLLGWNTEEIQQGYRNDQASTSRPD